MAADHQGERREGRLTEPARALMLKPIAFAVVVLVVAVLVFAATRRDDFRPSARSSSRPHPRKSCR